MGDRRHPNQHNPYQKSRGGHRGNHGPQNNQQGSYTNRGNSNKRGAFPGGHRGGRNDPDYSDEPQNQGQSHHRQNDNGGRRSHGDEMNGYGHGQQWQNYHQHGPNHQELNGNCSDRGASRQEHQRPDYEWTETAQQNRVPAPPLFFQNNPLAINPLNRQQNHGSGANSQNDAVIGANLNEQLHRLFAVNGDAQQMPGPVQQLNVYQDNWINQLPIATLNNHQYPNRGESSHNNSVNGGNPNKRFHRHKVIKEDIQQTPVPAQQSRLPHQDPKHQLPFNPFRRQQNPGMGESSRSSSVNRSYPNKQLHHQAVNGVAKQSHGNAQQPNFPHHDSNHKLPINPLNRQQNHDVGKSSSHSPENGAEPIKQVHNHQAVNLKTEPVRSPEAQQHEVLEVRPEEQLSQADLPSRDDLLQQIQCLFGRLPAYLNEKLGSKTLPAAQIPLPVEHPPRPALNQHTCTLEEGKAELNKQFGEFFSRFGLEIVSKKEKNDVTDQTNEVEEAIEERKEVGQIDDPVFEPIVRIEESVQNALENVAVVQPVAAEPAAKIVPVEVLVEPMTEEEPKDAEANDSIGDDGNSAQNGIEVHADVPAANPEPEAKVSQDINGIVPTEEIDDPMMGEEPKDAEANDSIGDDDNSAQNGIEVHADVPAAHAEPDAKVSQDIDGTVPTEEMDDQRMEEEQRAEEANHLIGDDDNSAQNAMDAAVQPASAKPAAGIAPSEELGNQIMEEEARAAEANNFIGDNDTGYNYDGNDFDMGGPLYENDGGASGSNIPRQDEQEDDMEPLEDETIQDAGVTAKVAPEKRKTTRRKKAKRNHYAQRKSRQGPTNPTESTGGEAQETSEAARSGASADGEEQEAPAAAKPTNQRDGKGAKKEELKQSDSVRSSTSSAEQESPERDTSPEVDSQGHFAGPSPATTPPTPNPNFKRKTNAEPKPKPNRKSNQPKIQVNDDTTEHTEMKVADESDTEDDDATVASTSSTKSYYKYAELARKQSQEGDLGEDETRMDEDEEEKMEEDLEELEIQKPQNASRKRSNPTVKHLSCPNLISRTKAKKNKKSKEHEGASDDEEKEIKRIEHNEKQSFRWDSYKWWLGFNLEYIMANMSHFFPNNMFYRSGKPTKITEARIKKIKNLTEFILASEDASFLQARVYLDTVFPDEGNYRHLDEYFKFNTIQHKDAPTDRVRRTSPLCNLLPRLHLTGALYLPPSSGSQEVLEAGREFLEWNTNLVWEDVGVKAKEIGKPDGKLHEKEVEFYKDSMDEKKPLRMPVPTFHPTSKEDLHSPEFAKMIQNNHMVLVPNFGKTLGLDHSLYTVEELAKRAPDMVINNIVQSPQSADDNFSQKGVRGWQCFGTSDEKTDIPLIKYKEYYEGEKKHAAHVFEALALCNAKDVGKVIEKCMEEKIECQQIACNDFEKGMFAIRFASNIDLYDDAFQAQLNELEKLPLVLCPSTPRDLLDHCDVDVLGINTVQMYVKTPGSRTPAHVENSLMGSINWNVGPGTCIWFVVAYEYWGQVKKLIEKHGHKWQSQDFWPSEQDLIDAGIPYMKFAQEADAMVHVGTGSIHWVQSNGYCVNVSWNIGHGTFNQIAAAAIEYDNVQQEGLMQHIPLMTALVNVANQRKFVENEQVVEVIRSMLIRGLGHQKMYFDVLNELNLLPNGDEHKMGTYPARCNKCACEVFNIVKWMRLKQNLVDKLEKEFAKERKLNEGKESKDEILEKKEKMEGEILGPVYCGNCQPEAELFKTRFEHYTYSWSVEDLALILDSYKYRKDATAESKFPWTILSPGGNGADEPSTSD